MKHIAIPLVLLLSVLPLFFGCEEVAPGSPYGKYVSTPAVDADFHAEWKSDAECMLHFGAEIYKPDEYYYYNSYVYNGRFPRYAKVEIQKAPGARGPWQTIHGPVQYELSSRDLFRDSLLIDIGNPDVMQYFRIQLFVTEENFFEAERSRIIATKHPVAVPGSWELHRILARKSPPPSPATPGSTVLDPESERIIVSHGNTVAFNVSTGQDISPSTNSWLLTGDLRWYGENLYEVNTKRVESYSYYYERRFFSIYNAGTLAETRKEECDVGFHGDELRIYMSHRDYNYWLVYDPISNDFNSGASRSNLDVRSLETLSKQPEGDAYVGLLMEDASDLNVSWALYNGNFDLTGYISPFYSLGDTKLEIEPYRGERLFHPRWVTDNIVVFYAWFSGAKELWAYSLSSGELTQITGYERGVVPGQHGEYESSYAGAPSFTYDPVRDKIMLICIHDSFRYDLLLIDPPR